MVRQKHLRPLPRGPVLFQLVLNAAIGFTLCWLMWNRDEFMSEAAPAVGLLALGALLIQMASDLANDRLLTGQHWKDETKAWHGFPSIVNAPPSIPGAAEFFGRLCLCRGAEDDRVILEAAASTTSA